MVVAVEQQQLVVVEFFLKVVMGEQEVQLQLTEPQQLMLAVVEAEFMFVVVAQEQLDQELAEQAEVDQEVQQEDQHLLEEVKQVQSTLVVVEAVVLHKDLVARLEAVELVVAEL